MFFFINYLIILLKNCLVMCASRINYYDHSYLLNICEARYPSFLLSEFLVDKKYVYVQIEGKWYDTNTIEFYLKVDDFLAAKRRLEWTPSDLSSSVYACIIVFVFYKILSS